MSGPKTSEYTLTPEQRANLNAQNRCDNSILTCIERIKTLEYLWEVCKYMMIAAVMKALHLRIG